MVEAAVVKGLVVRLVGELARLAERGLGVRHERGELGRRRGVEAQQHLEHEHAPDGTAAAEREVRLLRLRVTGWARARARAGAGARARAGARAGARAKGRGWS